MPSGKISFLEKKDWFFCCIGSVDANVCLWFVSGGLYLTDWPGPKRDVSELSW